MISTAGNTHRPVPRDADHEFVALDARVRHQLPIVDDVEPEAGIEQARHERRADVIAQHLEEVDLARLHA